MRWHARYSAINSANARKSGRLPSTRSCYCPSTCTPSRTLPSGDANYSRRWAWIKKEFTKEWLAIGGREERVSKARQERGDHGIWQPRYWEHTIEDEHDFDRHFDYIHYNPVKHGHVSDPAYWPHSSLHRWLQRGVYEVGWGAAHRGPLLFDDLNETAMEME